MQAPSLITVIPTHVSVKDVGFQANPALIKITSSPNVPIAGPDKTEKSFQSSPPPSNPPTNNDGSGTQTSESVDPGVTFDLPSLV